MIFDEAISAKHKSFIVLIFKVGKNRFIIKRIAKNSYRTPHGKTSRTLA